MTMVHLPQPVNRAFAISLSAVLAVLLLLFSVLVRYASISHPFLHVQQYFTWFQAVEIMCLLGFGFLYSFLRRYGYSALGMTYLLSAVVMVEAVVLLGAFQQMVWGGSSKIWLDLPLAIDAAFCAASTLIWLGAVIGKTSPTQLLYLAVLFVPLYAVNQHLVMETLKALDVGGSITIHAFGAYYGLAASLVVSRRQASAGASHPLLSASYQSDVAAMVGVFLIWVYWPSFNGALVSVDVEPGELPSAVFGSQFLTVINTWLSLLGATISTFAASALIEGGKLNMVHIQNASLAGGVIIGSAANLDMSPGGALGMGTVAGAVTTFGYAYLTPYLERRIGLLDTAGIHNLHAIPGVLGGFAAGLIAWGQSEELLGHGNAQLGFQIVSMVVTIAISVAGGLVAGWLVTVFNPQPMSPHALFDDTHAWVHVEPLGHEHAAPAEPPVDASSREGTGVQEMIALADP